MCEVMASTHTNIGKTHEEAEKLQNDHKKFESTAQVGDEYIFVLSVRNSHWRQDMGIAFRCQ